MNIKILNNIIIVIFHGWSTSISAYVQKTYLHLILHRSHSIILLIFEMTAQSKVMSTVYFFYFLLLFWIWVSSCHLENTLSTGTFHYFSSPLILLKKRQQAQNGVTWIKPYIGKPRFNTEINCSFNFPGMSPLLQSTGNYLISTKKIIYPIGPFHSP